MNDMPPLQDLTGKRFGRLEVLSRVNKDSKTVYWLCKCECGNEKVIQGNKLKKWKHFKLWLFA